MNLSDQMAGRIREAWFGENWIAPCLKEQLAGLTWEQATEQVDSFNTIAALVYHVDYYVSAVVKVLEGGSLDAHDKYSFDLPPINSQEDWDRLLEKTWADAERLAELLEALPEEKLFEDFWEAKYGDLHRNCQGVIEHLHYHLGQIALIRKLQASASQT